MAFSTYLLWSLWQEICVSILPDSSFVPAEDLGLKAIAV
jgi:hypothetical protein